MLAASNRTKENNNYMRGRQLDMSRARTMGQVQKVTRVENPRYLARHKTGATRTSPQGDRSSPSMLLVMWFKPPDPSYCRSCGLDPPLNFPSLSNH